MEFGQITHGIGEAVRHPLATATHVVGGVRDLVRAGAGTIAHVIAGGSPEQDHRPTPVRPDPGARIAAEAAAPAPPTRPAVPAEPPGFAHEPKASSRSSAHGGRGADRDDVVDDWEAEADPSVPDATQPRPEPVDDGTLKAIRTEAEIMRRAADPHPE